MSIENSLRILKSFAKFTAAILVTAALMGSCDLSGSDSSFVENRTWRQVGDVVSESAAHQSQLTFGPDGTPYVVYMDDNAADSWTAQALLTVKKFNGTEWVTIGSEGFAPPGGIPSQDNNVRIIGIAVADDGTVYVAYPDTVDADNDIVADTGANETDDSDGDSEISVMKYNTSDSSWEYVGSAAFSEVSVNAVSITTDGNAPVVSYTEGTTNANDQAIIASGYDYLFVKKFNGTDWVAIGDSSNDLNLNDIYDAVGNLYQFDPVAADKDGNIFTVFDDCHDNATPLVMKMYSSSTGSWTMSYGTSSAVTKQSITVDNNGNAFAAYLLTDQGGGPVYAQKFNGSTGKWEAMGGSFETYSYNPSIAVDKKGIVYVAYGNGNNRVSVKEYYVGSWSFAGSNADNSISVDTVYNMSIAVNPQTDTPYLAIEDEGVSGTAEANSFPALVVYRLVE